MSLLSDFKAAAHAIFKQVAGTEPVTIGGGTALNGILNESQFSRDYETGGFEQSGTLEFVIDKATFVASYPLLARFYEGKSATARGETWRVQSVNVGLSFVRISLQVPNKSS